MNDPNIFVYSTEYHLSQLKLVRAPVIMFRVGYKNQSTFARLAELFKCILIISIRRGSTVYMPRSSAKDNYFIYKLFKKRAVLFSDGLSDLVRWLEVWKLGFLRFGFELEVSRDFHVLFRTHRFRPLGYKESGPVAVFNKRGRDPDYVSAYVNAKVKDKVVLNPAGGDFRHVYAAPSTVLFELDSKIKRNVSIVSQAHCDGLSAERRRLILQYEKVLEELGYRIE